MSMARFETGKTGNPHYHGFSVGRRGPIMKRVRDDEKGQEDLPPDTASGDLDVFLEWLRSEDSTWQFGEQRSRADILGMISDVLEDGGQLQDLGAEEGAGALSDSDEDGAQKMSLAQRAPLVVEQLIEKGLLSEVRTETFGESELFSGASSSF